LKEAICIFNGILYGHFALIFPRIRMEYEEWRLNILDDWSQKSKKRVVSLGSVGD
jgi:hypothetical protein